MSTPTLLLAGYLFTEDHLEAWAAYYNLRTGPGMIDTLDSVERHGREQCLPSYFQWVDLPGDGGDKVPGALLLTGTLELAHQIEGACDLRRLVPEHTPLAEFIRDAWITPLLAGVPSLQSIAYTVVKHAAGEPCKSFGHCIGRFVLTGRSHCAIVDPNFVASAKKHRRRGVVDHATSGCRRF